MRKIFAAVLALTLVSIITVSGTATASAQGKNKQPIEFNATLAVQEITGLSSNGNSGWSSIELETLAGIGLVNVVEGPAEISNLYLTAAQSSREQFTSNPLLTPWDTSVVKGKSKGTFHLSVPVIVNHPVYGPIPTAGGDVLVVGEYDLKVSSSAGCQISGIGNWKSKAKNSIIEGHGEITVCTNFVPAFGTFVSSVSVTGNAAVAD